MLKTPWCGWSEITIGNWHDRCSYLDDVPYRLLEAVDHVNRTGTPSAVKFDAEGWSYIIVFDMYHTHIICDGIDVVYKYYTVDIHIKDLARDLISDIRRDIKAWSEWFGNISDYEAEERKLDLEAWCNVIEKRL
jgi:hypothetical protein